VLAAAAAAALLGITWSVEVEILAEGRRAAAAAAAAARFEPRLQGQSWGWGRQGARSSALPRLGGVRWRGVR
jgi:hypothetical protein